MRDTLIHTSCVGNFIRLNTGPELGHCHGLMSVQKISASSFVKHNRISPSYHLKARHQQIINE